MQRVHAFRASGLAALLLAVAGTRPAAASCGSAACFLVTHAEEGVQSKGSVQIDLSYRYVDQSKMLDGSRGTDTVLVPEIDFDAQTIGPEQHREISTRNTLVQLGVAYGATARLSVFGTVPLFVDKAHEHYDEAGTPEETFTNADGTSGFGDVAFGVRYALLVKANDLLMGSLALKVPTGPYKLLDSEGSIDEPTLQPGTGSYDGSITLHYVRHQFPSSLEWFVAGSQRFNGTNSLDYRIGDETVLSGGVGYAAGERWVFSLQANARHAGRDHYLDEGVPSTGSDAISLTPGIRFGPGKELELYVYLQFPVYQDVNESQLAPRTGFVVGLTKRF